MFLRFRGTSDFSLLPLRTRAVTVAQRLVFSFFLITSSFWCDQAETPLLTFHFQDPLRLLILAIWSSSLFQLFGCPPFFSFFPNSWNLLPLGWKFSSNHFYLLFFSFLVPCCTTPLFINVCSIFFDSSLHDWALETQLFFSTVVILFGLCCASQGSPGSGILWDPSLVSPIGLFFGLLTLANWAFLLLYGI